ncbi:hypothetical protein STRDD11_01572 [Streptococcus sp. DD11]|nr:hypothetical protein STRDD11_01572 [Streptococcus sp. DD11]
MSSLTLPSGSFIRRLKTSGFEQLAALSSSILSDRLEVSLLSNF